MATSKTYRPQSSKPRSTLRNGPTYPWSKSNNPSLHQNTIKTRANHVYGTADLVDQYGNNKTEQVVALIYTRATLNKINWNGIDFHDMWNIADSAVVHPAFQY
jgi:hypothetical protein